MTVNAQLSPDRNLVVTETIVYDFEENNRHGIFRIIPDTSLRQGARYRLHFNVLDVTMDGREVMWKTMPASGGLEIKIGDPDYTISGKHAYRIRYATTRAMNSFSEGDEVYWNVTGDAWEVGIGSALFQLTAPTSSTATLCFTGAYGSTEHACSVAVDGVTTTVSTTRPLSPREGFTIVVRFPPGTVQPVSWGERLGQIVMDNLWTLLPVLVFIGMGFLWWRKGREPRGRGAVIPQYDYPRGLPPALLTSLMEQRMSERAVTATLLDLARRGYAKVTCTPNLFITKRNADVRALHPFEKALYDALFLHRQEVTVYELKGEFWRAIEKSRKEMFEELHTRELFEKNPSVIRTIWIMVACVLVAVGFFATNDLGGGFFLSMLICAVIVAVFGWQMPRMTKEGAILVEEAKGFKVFLSVTEKARLDFTDAPERSPEQFAMFLPAAVAFGVEEKWAKQFEGIDMVPPSYLDGAWTATSSVAISHLLSDLHTSAMSSYSAPSSGGSGHSGFSGGGSGGGFGGGGGGSW